MTKHTSHIEIADHDFNEKQKRSTIKNDYKNNFLAGRIHIMEIWGLKKLGQYDNLTNIDTDIPGPGQKSKYYIIISPFGGYILNAFIYLLNLLT